MKYICPQQIKKGRSGMREVINKVRDGYSIALMVDQRVGEGLKIKFFSSPAQTTTIPAQLAIKYNCKIVYPEDGTVAAPDGIALVKNGPNSQNGKIFIDWALSKETQDFLVQEMGRRPIRTDVSASGDLPPLSSFKVVPYDFSWSAGNKDLFRKKWNDLLIGD